ncbi:hypothetical protein JIG36_47765 [Actinoplanes sp. LDG1-06]|uniref:Uncharacterized protein n=1 Tax=Paractinoplanes ovalisporus TaxID=2810368 RepID=A0ABS2ATL9_9ACTN|nr:hypothetical protein [Actinoplanes ovalisporus]MBM2623220.1 hypothetical protein [Actinoplanes ovalisporus]
MTAATYARIFGRAAQRAVMSGAWVATLELPPAQRRTVRAAMIAAAATASIASSGGAYRAALSSGPSPSSGPPPASAPVDGGPVDRQRAVFGATATALVVTAIVVQRRLEKRWLDTLTRKGHPHPVRGLALRAAATDFAGSVAAQFATRHWITPAAARRAA